MIYFPAKHYFEALSPQLEEDEEEIFFHHPTEDLYCNQLGIIFYNEEKYYMVHTSAGTTLRYTDRESGHQTKRAVGAKARIVWECYNSSGKTMTHPHFYHRNGNVMDFSYGNVVTAEDLTSKERMMVAGKRRRFIQESIRYLIQLEKKHEEGMGIEALYQSLMLPDWLVNGRQKLDGAPPKKERRPYTGGGRKSLVTLEEEEKVEELYFAGLTFKQITAEMGWKSLTKAKRIVRVRGLSRRNK